MFSGRWDQPLDHDSQGRIFLDFEPYCFQQILTSLRCRQLTAGAASKVPGQVIEHESSMLTAAWLTTLAWKRL